MEEDFGPRTDQWTADERELEMEATDNPLAIHDRHADACGYVVAGETLPSGSTAIAWRASPAINDRVTDYPERLAQCPNLINGAAAGTIWAAREDSSGWIRTYENGLWLPKRYLAPVDHQGDALTDSKNRTSHEEARGFALKLRGRKRLAEVPSSASTTSDPPAPSSASSVFDERQVHEMEARLQAQRALAIVLDGLEGILPASRALFRPMGLANGRPRWCQPDDDDLYHAFDQSLEVSPAEHKLFEGSLGLQMYFFPPNAKWFVATHFEPRRDSAFAWVQADGAVPVGTSSWKVQGSYDGEQWIQVPVRIRELTTEEEVKRYQAFAYLDELVDCAKRTDSIQAQAHKVRRCGFLLSGHPQKSFNGLYRPRNTEAQRSMRWPALETALALLKQSVRAHDQLEIGAADLGGNACVDSPNAMLDSRFEGVAELHCRSLRAIQSIKACDRCLPPVSAALELHIVWLRGLCEDYAKAVGAPTGSVCDSGTLRQQHDHVEAMACAWSEHNLINSARGVNMAVPLQPASEPRPRPESEPEPEPQLQPQADDRRTHQGADEFEEDQRVDAAEKLEKTVDDVIETSLQHVAAYTEAANRPHLHGNWPHYVNDEDKHLYYYYPWGRWFINSGFTPMERRRGGEIKTDGALPEEVDGCVWKVWLGKQWSKATVRITAMHSLNELEAHKRRQAARIGRQAMEVEWLELAGLSCVLGAPNIVMKQVGDANNFPCWKSTHNTLFLFFFRGEWIIHHECIRENLGQPYFPPRRPLACEAFLPTLDCCPIGTHLWMVQSRKKWVARSLCIQALVTESLLEVRQRLAAGKLLHHRMAECALLQDTDLVQRVGVLCESAQLERRCLRHLEEYRGRQDQQISPGTVLRVGDSEVEYIAWKRKRGGANLHVLRHLTGSMMGETVDVKLSALSWHVLRPPLGQQQQEEAPLMLREAQGSDEPQWYEAVRKIALTCGVDPSSKEIGTVQKGDFLLIRERRMFAGLPRVRCAFGWAPTGDLRLFARIAETDQPNVEIGERDVDSDGKFRATALFTWDEDAGASPDELIFRQGDRIVIEGEGPGEGWMTGSIDGRVGIFPTSYVEIHKQSEQTADPGENCCNSLGIIMARLEEQLYARAPIILSKTDCRNLLDRSSRRVDWALCAVELRLHHRHVEWDCCQAVSRCSGHAQKAALMLREWRMLSLLAANFVVGSACVLVLMLIGYADEDTNLMWSCVYANIFALCVIDFYFFMSEQRMFLGTQPPRHARRALDRAEIDRPGPHKYKVSVSSVSMASLFLGDDEDNDEESEHDEHDKSMCTYAMHNNSEDTEGMEIVVSESCVELRRDHEMVCQVKMRWLKADASLRLAEENPHRLVFHPEFFQLPGSRIRHGQRLDIWTAQPSIELHNLIRRRQEPVQVPASAELSRHHCEWLRPLILRWVPAYACLSIYISLKATEYGPYFAGGPSAILILFLLGVSRSSFLGIYPDRAVLINVLRGEFDISMGYAHSMSPSRYIWFGSPAVWIIMFALILRFTMMLTPSTALCAVDTRPIKIADPMGSAGNGTASKFGGISSNHTSFDGLQDTSEESEAHGEQTTVDDYKGEDLHGIFTFSGHTSQQIRTIPPDHNTCSGSTSAWMDTLQISGPCLHDDGTTACSLPTVWEGQVPRKICLQTSFEAPCGAVLPAVVQRCAHGRYRYKLPTPEATVINSGELALLRGSANLTWGGNVKVGMPPIIIGMVSGDIRAEYMSQAWINGPFDNEDSDSLDEDANRNAADPQQLLIVQMQGSKFVAPAQSCTATVSNGTREDAPSWALAQNTQCETVRAARTGRVAYGNYTSVSEAKAACLQRSDCQAISGPSPCNGSGPWTLCRKLSGHDSSEASRRPSCMHLRKMSTPARASACLREPWLANLTLASERTVACAPRSTGSAYIMYTQESASRRFATVATGKRSVRMDSPRLVSSITVPRGTQATREYSEHFVCVAFEKGVGWVYDTVAAARNPDTLNASSITFVPASSDVLVARVEYGRTYHGSYCLEDTPPVRVRRNVTGGVPTHTQLANPLVVYPIVWFVVAVLLICDDPFYWGCNSCRATGPHGMWCV